MRTRRPYPALQQTRPSRSGCNPRVSQAGSAMLVAHDMDTRVDLSPWLAGVFVTPEQRRHGVGAALVQRVIDEATALGVRRLYLYTPSTEHFYSRLGWSLVERTSYEGVDVAVMSYEVMD